jgi:hypothetical protein
MTLLAPFQKEKLEYFFNFFGKYVCVTTSSRIERQEYAGTQRFNYFPLLWNVFVFARNDIATM